MRKQQEFLAGRKSVPSTGGAEGSGAAASGDDPNALARYHRHIQRRFRERWVQPTSVFTQQARFVTTVAITIRRDGNVESVRLVKPSGDPAMDQSVMEAARSVRRIDPLPRTIRQDPYVVSIDFERL